MNKKRGYVLLWRSMQDSEIWDSDDPFDMRSAWIDLIMMAAHKDTSFIMGKTRISILRGQIYTSVRKLAARWRWGKDKTLRFLRLLEDMEMIRRDATVNRTLLTLINYGVLQDPRDSDKDSNEDTNKDTNEDSTAPHTKNVRKNVRKKKEEGGDSRTYEE